MKTNKINIEVRQLEYTLEDQELAMDIREKLLEVEEAIAREKTLERRIFGDQKFMRHLVELEQELLNELWYIEGKAI